MKNKKRVEVVSIKGIKITIILALKKYINVCFIIVYFKII